LYQGTRSYVFIHTSDIKRMRRKSIIKNYKIHELFLLFLSYSFIGWLYEVLLGIFVFQLGFVNRGFLFGPYCPVYGFGALLFILTLEKMKDVKIRVFNINLTPCLILALITTMTTLVELITSYLMEAVLGEWLWDYTGYFMNFQGRIALSTSLRFGLGGMVILYILNPWLKNKILPNRYTKMISYILFVVFAIDMIARLFVGSNFTNAIKM